MDLFNESYFCTDGGDDFIEAEFMRAFLSIPMANADTNVGTLDCQGDAAGIDHPSKELPGTPSLEEVATNHCKCWRE